jgi:thioredoxin 1
MVKDLTEKQFQEEILSTEVTIVDFYTPWCGPCKKLLPALDSVAAAGNRVFKLNAENYPEVCSEYGVMSVPTLLYFKDGKNVSLTKGLVTEAQINITIGELG